MSYIPNPSRRSTMSPLSSPSSPISIRSRPQLGQTPSDTDALTDIFPTALTQFTTNSSTQAYSSALRKSSTPSAYVSDADLFGDDEVAYMKEAPAPPRSAELWEQQVARPLLPPVLDTKLRRSSNMSSKQKSRRTSSNASKVSSKG